MNERRPDGHKMDMAAPELPMTDIDYVGEIIEMLRKVDNQEYLKSIYWFVKRLKG